MGDVSILVPTGGANADGTPTLAPLTLARPLPVQLMGGGAATPLADILCTDTVGGVTTHFVWRDNGATLPVFTAYTVPDSQPYTPSAAWTPWAVTGLPPGAATDASLQTLHGDLTSALADLAQVHADGGTTLATLLTAIKSAVTGTLQTYDNSGIAHAPAQFVGLSSTASAVSTPGAGAGAISAPSWATQVWIQVVTGTLIYRCDGTAPTLALGVQIASGQTWVLPIAAWPALQLIGTATFSAEFRG